jgi:hypothetical protein
MTATEGINLETYKRWAEDVWRDGKTEIVADLVLPQYVRHEPEGTRSVTPEELAAQIQAFRSSSGISPGSARWPQAWIFAGDFLTFLCLSPIAQVQVYRFDKGRLAETWASGSLPGVDWDPNAPPRTIVMSEHSASEAANQEVVRRWVEEVWRGDSTLVPRLCEPEFRRHGARGLEVATHESLTAEFSGVQGRVVGDLPKVSAWYLAARDYVTVIFRIPPVSRGQENGPPVPVPSRSGVQLFRLAGGRLAETWYCGVAEGVDW